MDKLQKDLDYSNDQLKIEREHNVAFVREIGAKDKQLQTKNEQLEQMKEQLIELKSGGQDTGASDQAALKNMQSEIRNLTLDKKNQHNSLTKTIKELKRELADKKAELSEMGQEYQSEHDSYLEMEQNFVDDILKDAIDIATDLHGTELNVQDAIKHVDHMRSQIDTYNENKPSWASALTEKDEESDDDTPAPLNTVLLEYYRKKVLELERANQDLEQEYKEAADTRKFEFDLENDKIGVLKQKNDTVKQQLNEQRQNNIELEQQNQSLAQDLIVFQKAAENAKYVPNLVRDNHALKREIASLQSELDLSRGAPFMTGAMVPGALHGVVDFRW